MKVCIAAIAHFDPLCKPRLSDWLSMRSSTDSQPPLFVGVEWDRNTFAKVKQQRLLVRQLAQKEWPNADADFINALVDAMGFEGDTHVDHIPSTNTIWLDQGREVKNSTIITNYAEDRIRVYKSYIPEDTVKFDASTLATMSIEAWNRLGERPEGGTPRDVKFAGLIIQELLKSPESWAITIVGANHASRDEGYVTNLLENYGIECNVEELRPGFQVA